VPSPTTLRSRAWIAPIVLVGVALVLRLGALLTHRHLTFDDGCYGVSTIDMRHNLAPYRDLFSSQGPLHYPLLYVGDVLSGHMRNGPRVVPVLAGMFIPVAVWATARRLGAEARIAFVVGLLVAITGTMLWSTGPVTGDGPAVAFTMGAVWMAVAFRDRPAWWRAALAGLLFGAGLATKFIVFPAVIPITWWCWRRRRFTDLVLAGSATLLAWFAAAVPWGVGRVWDQSIAFHLEKGAHGNPIEQFGEILSWLGRYDVMLTAAVLLLIVGLVFGRRAHAALRSDAVVITVWIGVVVLALTFEKLLLASHLAVLVPPLALLLAVRPPPARWLLIALIALIPLQALEVNTIVVPRGYRGDEAQLMARLRALPKQAQVISDSQGFVWQSGHYTPRWLNDNSLSRIEQGRLTTSMVAAGAAEAKTCAVVMWTTRFTQHMPGLRAALESENYAQHVYAPGHELWVKRSCA
jgi:hypothetical protein